MIASFWRKLCARPRLVAADTASAAGSPELPSPVPVRALPDIDPLAKTAIRLADLGPRLAELASTAAEQAEAQERYATDMAATMGRLGDALEHALTELRGSSGAVGEALSTVSEIAAHTRILSLNASIEAARAGEQGRAFAVVVDEVRGLANRTGETTHAISARMGAMEDRLGQVEALLKREAEAVETGEPTVGAVSRQALSVASTAGRQRGGAVSLHALGDEVHRLTDDLLLRIGVFRLRAHAQAEEALRAALAGCVAAEGSRESLERALSEWLQEHPFFELAYVTNAAGRQVIDNLVQKDGQIAHDPSGFGRDWSDRPWYLAARATREPISTDIYRSTATQDYCFTVAAEIWACGACVGVLAADVNFRRLLEQ